jgi:hypothetical protein
MSSYHYPQSHLGAWVLTSSLLHPWCPGAGILLLFYTPGDRVLASFFSSISLVPGCWHPSSLLYPWCLGAGILLLFYIPGARLLFYIPGAWVLASFFSSISLVPGCWHPSSLLYPWCLGAGILLLFYTHGDRVLASFFLYPWCPGAGILLLFYIPLPGCLHPSFFCLGARAVASFFFSFILVPGPSPPLSYLYLGAYCSGTGILLVSPWHPPSFLHLGAQVLTSSIISFPWCLGAAILHLFFFLVPWRWHLLTFFIFVFRCWHPSFLYLCVQVLASFFSLSWCL